MNMGRASAVKLAPSTTHSLAYSQTSLGVPVCLLLPAQLKVAPEALSYQADDLKVGSQEPGDRFSNVSSPAQTSKELWLFQFLSVFAGGV